MMHELVPECDKCVIEGVRERPVSLLPKGPLLVLQRSEDDGRDGEKGEEEEEEEDKALGSDNDCFRPVLQGNNSLRHLAAERSRLTKTFPKSCLENIHLALSGIYSRG